MDMHLLLNKNLKANYEKAIKVTTKEECDAFVNSLSERDHMELISYCEDVALINKRNHGVPVTEYFLLHLKEHITESEKKSGSAAHATNYLLTLIPVITIGPMLIRTFTDGNETMRFILFALLAIFAVVIAFKFSFNWQNAFNKSENSSK